MNKDQLKELVKQHFNLVDYSETVTEKTEEKFGELYDENKAFKIVFPGDTLKVGDEVKVVTTDGQESLAPDGYHKLEDGTTIKTEGSSVVEIESPEGNKEEEMAENPGLAAKNEEEIASEKVATKVKENGLVAYKIHLPEGLDPDDFAQSYDIGFLEDLADKMIKEKIFEMSVTV